MSIPIKTQSVLFPEVFRKALLAGFDEPHTSSDGGAVLVKAADRRLGLTQRLASCLRDWRQEGKVVHSLLDLLRQRIFGLACGYEDCNDSARLSDDPIQKLLLDRDPVDGDALGSSPTLCRFENSADRVDLYRMGETLAETVVQRHRSRLNGKAKVITLDLDPTDDTTHGAQQLSFFNGHYDSWCYLPMVATVQFDKESEMFALAAVLRPGNATAKVGAIGLLRRLLALLRKAFPEARIRVRLDGGYSAPEVLSFLDSQKKNKVDYIVGYAENSVLLAKGVATIDKARKEFEETGNKSTVYGECQYAAKSWKKKERRVIIKAEFIPYKGRETKQNVRFVVTSLPGSPKHLYRRVYCGRGEMENRLKELKQMGLGRTSCSSFLANQLRVLISLAAYVLMQEVRFRAAGTMFARAQVWILREKLFKVAVRVVSTARRFILHLPADYPYKSGWLQIASSLAAGTS